MRDSCRVLGDVAKIQSGFAFSSSDFVDSGVPIVRMSNLKNGQLDFNNSIYVSHDALNSCEDYQLKEGDLLLGMSGSLSNYAIVKREDCPALLNQRVARLSAVSEDALYGYLRYFLTSENYFFYADYVSEGAAQKNISARQIESYEVYLPPVKQQQQIANILTTVDNLIEKTQALIDKYTAVKQGMMHDLFTRGIDLATGQLRPSYEQAPELYKETELGWVPREWGVVRLGDIAVRVGSGVTPTGGSDVYISEGVVFLRSQNITFEGLKLNDVAYIDDRTHRSMNSSEVFAFDVLINITGASIGRCCYMPEGFDAVNSNQHVCSIRFHEPTESKAIFLSQVLSSYIGQSQIHCLNAGGNREGLNYQQLRSFNIPWPNDREISAISERLIAADKNIEKNKIIMDKVAVQKKGLMQDLLTGRVRVNCS